ncbi:MAG: hypothetical protein V4619_18235 [Bacteroidota bacterium]
MYIFLTIAKGLICLIGFAFAVIFLTQGINGEAGKKKKAIWTIVVTFLILVLLSGIEFVIAVNK